MSKIRNALITTLAIIVFTWNLPVILLLILTHITKLDQFKRKLVIYLIVLKKLKMIDFTKDDIIGKIDVNDEDVKEVMNG